MQTIQVAVDGRLLRAADSAAGRKKIDRSALVREALREHLKRIEQKDNERRDRLGYQHHPDADVSAWEAVAAWPNDENGAR
jgi:metal-responsive CopG/Arc/MetJ family transcriptional regulator